MELAIAEQFVDDLADIVDGGVTRERDHAGLRIDLDFAKVAAIGKVSMARRAARFDQRHSGRHQ
jgi:hypothetical protein